MTPDKACIFDPKNCIMELGELFTQKEKIAFAFFLCSLMLALSVFLF